MANTQTPKWQQQMRAKKEAELLKKQQEKRKKLYIGLAAGAVILIAAVVLCLVFAPKSPAPSETEAETALQAETTVDMTAVSAAIDSMQVTDFVETTETTDYVKLTIQDYGELVLCLCPETAPITVENFQSLVGQNFYDGLTFHRVYPDFMIQGGDPEGNGTGGSGTEITGEFSSNGIQNDLSHLRGVVSMARSSDNDSASSQFFICHADSDFLDGSYAAFGYVVAGLSTVDNVCGVELEANSSGELSSPVTPVVITSAVFVTPNE